MSTPSPRARGVGRILIAGYALLAIAATGRSFVQIASKLSEAPFAYLLSGLAALVYILATIALVRRGEIWTRIATFTIGFELLGVLLIGTLSITRPDLFAHPSVWSWFGAGYVFIPLVLPILGLLWIRRTSSRQEAAA